MRAVRRRIMNTSILPAGYTQVEYVELPSGAYIDTGYVPTGTSVQISGAFEVLTYSVYGYIIATYKNEQTNVYRLILGSSDNNKLYANGGSVASGGSTLISYQKNMRYDFILTNTNLILNGVSSNLSTNQGDVNDQPLRISSPSRPTHIRVYSLHVKDGDQEKLHLIPCIHNNETGMYDVTNRRFLTSATNISCIAGQKLIWNQLIINGNFANGTQGWKPFNSTIEMNENYISLVKTGTAGYGGIVDVTISEVNTAHKYFIKATIRVHDTSIPLNFGFHSVSYTVSGNTIIQSDSAEWETIDGIVSPKANNCILLLRIGSGASPLNVTGDIKNVWCVDLTKMFGEGNEPTTVEEFKAMFPHIYYEYTEAEIIYGRLLQSGEFWPQPI